MKITKVSLAYEGFYATPVITEVVTCVLSFRKFQLGPRAGIPDRE